jgi:hypothetical protein
MRRLHFRARVSLGVLTTLMVPMTSAAQPSPDSPTLPRFDVAALTGWVRANSSDLPAEVYSPWDATAVGALIFGFYWTEHVKGEVEIGFSGERSVDSGERLDLGPNLSRYLYRQHHLRSRSFSLTPTYQGLHNAWIHPFVGLGLDVDWERRRTESRIQTIDSRSNPPVFTNEPLSETFDRTVRARAAFSTGFKGYVTRKAFVRSDLRIAFARGVEEVKWRIGGGFDF